MYYYLTEHEIKMRKSEKLFLDKEIFANLNYTNNDINLIKNNIYSYENFKEILKRCEKINVGVFGIETWTNEESWIDAKMCEEYRKEPNDKTWYWQAFYELSEGRNNLYFHASFILPNELIQKIIKNE